MRSSFAIVLTLAAVLPAWSGDDKDKVPLTVQFVLPVEREIANYATFTGPNRSDREDRDSRSPHAYLEKMNFAPGSEVRKGDVLFELDSRPYKAAVDDEAAKVAAAEAKLQCAESDCEVRVLISRSEMEIISRSEMSTLDD